MAKPPIKKKSGDAFLQPGIMVLVVASSDTLMAKQSQL
jgi:hypothetical protein